jgi:hypothetical protein
MTLNIHILFRQIKQIQEVAKREIVYDDDSPEFTPAMEKAFRLAAKNRNTHKNTAIS